MLYPVFQIDILSNYEQSLNGAINGSGSTALCDAAENPIVSGIWTRMNNDLNFYEPAGIPCSFLFMAWGYGRLG